MAVKISAKDVAALREQTGAGMMDCKKALTETGGDISKALDSLRTKGIASAEKRAGRNASEGIVANYMHFNGKIGVMVEVNCETDFVARTDEFAELARNIAIHIASANPIGLSEEDVPADVVSHERSIYEQQVAEQGKPEAVREKIVDGKIKKFFAERVLLQQAFVKDDKKTVGELVTEAGVKLGENVRIKRFVRFEIGVDQ